jgi:hypothetical protein
MGRGWYWRPEVAVAVKHWRRYVRIHSGWVFEPATDARPFATLPDLYALRAAYKAAGDPRQKALKLAMNSLYGKMAQGAGHGGKKPRYQSFAWAGFVTSATRAQVTAACLQDPGAVVMIATDGIVATRPLDLTGPEGLGGWDHEPADKLAAYQPGLYARWSNADQYVRTRGLAPADVDWEALEALWTAQRTDAVYEASVRSFIGLHLALARGKPETRCRWVDDRKRLRLVPSNAIPMGADPEGAEDVMSWAIPPLDQPRSWPYTPKRGNLTFGDGSPIVALMPGMSDPEPLAEVQGAELPG